MKSIKIIILIFAAVSFSQCKTMKLTETAPFKVTGATYFYWVGGQPGVSGTNLVIGVTNDANSTFLKIYFQNRVVDAKMENRNGKKYIVGNISTSNRREIKVVKTELKQGLGERINTKPKSKLNPSPFNLEANEAVISYMSGKKTYYYKVSKIKKTDTIYYP